jgi:pyruvate kinase
VEQIRARAAAAGRDVGVLADLQGPKIRIERFRRRAGRARRRGRSSSTPRWQPTRATIERGRHHLQGPAGGREPGDILLLNDGRISLTVDRVDGPRIHCRRLSPAASCRTARASTARAAACRRRH